jgi:cupin fold WbuC family metalloprotein
MKQIDAALLDSLTAKAKESPRKRAHHNLHPELNDPVQRLCIAMEPETYVRPHRHSEPATWEILMVLRGSIALLFFDDSGKVIARNLLTAEGQIRAIEFPQSMWHAPLSLEKGTVVFEVKQGPYMPIAEANLAFWAPAEDKPEAARFLEWYKHARPGDIPPH